MADDSIEGEVWVDRTSLQIRHRFDVCEQKFTANLTQVSNMGRVKRKNGKSKRKNKDFVVAKATK